MQKIFIIRKPHIPANISHTSLPYFLLLCYFTFIPSFNLRADDTTPKDGYISLGYGTSTFIQSDNPDIKSELSLTFNLGHSYHLHKNPVARCIWFDLDATWFNIAYSSFKVEHIDWQSSFKCHYHIPFIGMQVGPGITVVPFKKSQIHAYARYSPSLICLIENDIDNNLSFAYGSFWNFGLEFNYRAIGIGVDYANGKSSLPKLEFMSNSFSGKSESSTYKSIKFILSIKF